MKRVLVLAIAAYLAHLTDEALGGMHDDPIIVAAYAVLAPLGPRHAAYLLFQITFALGLLAVGLVAGGGSGRRAVLAVFGLVLLGEAHHPLRALLSGGVMNAGLLTSLPLPLLGARILSATYPLSKEKRCSSTSSSPWPSAGSSSVSPPSSPPVRAPGSSAFPPSTTIPPLA